MPFAPRLQYEHDDAQDAYERMLYGRSYGAIDAPDVVAYHRSRRVVRDFEPERESDQDLRDRFRLDAADDL